MNRVIGVVLAFTILAAGNLGAEELGSEPAPTAQTSMNPGLRSTAMATGLSFAGLIAPVGLSMMVLSSGSGGGSADVGLAVLIMGGTPTIVNAFTSGE